MKRLGLPLLISGMLLAAVAPEYISVKKKFDLIESHGAKRGSKIPVPAKELNAYVQAELPKVANKGIRNPRVELLGNNTATGHALINFLEVRRSRGAEPNWLLRKLLEGERPVSVTTRVASSGGTATVHVQRVEIAGVPIEGAALDFIIAHYLRPNYPDAKIGQPIQLGYGIERLEVAPGVAYIVMKK